MPSSGRLGSAAFCASANARHSTGKQADLVGRSGRPRPNHPDVLLRSVVSPSRSLPVIYIKNLSTQSLKMFFKNKVRVHMLIRI